MPFLCSSGGSGGPPPSAGGAPGGGGGGGGGRGSSKKPSQSQRCAEGQPGVGFGWVGGTSAALGFGPNGGYGLSGVASLGGGTFVSSAGSTQGTFGSAGAALTDNGSLGNYPTNNGGPRNQTWGVFGGIGAGLFLTNAGNTTTLAGPFTSYIASVGPLGVELAYSKGTWVVSVTAGKSTGGGVAVLQTNTFATECR